MKIKKIFLPLSVFLLFLGLYSCEEEITWEEEVLPEMLVVEGGLTNEMKIHEIQLTKSAPYFSNVKTPAVTGAIVSMTGNNSTIEFVENPEQPGIYETTVETSGIAGVEYTLNIELAGALNGTTRYKSTGTLIRGIELDTMEALLFENPFYFPGFGDDSLVTVCIAYGKEPAEIENFYQINLFHNNILQNDTIDEVSLTTDKEGMNGENVHTMYFFEQFNEDDTLQLEIISVEESYRNYVIGLQNIVNQSYDPFDMSGPPANALGNITGENGEEAIGFFKLAYVTKAETLVKMAEIDED